MNKLLVILGPTATGKTKLAVKLAQKFNGEIVSADSRQVYKGMDIGSGKDLKEYKKIKYHLIDVVSPNAEFNVAKFQKLAYTAIDDIIKRKKIPILVGGTGLYISAIIDGFVFPKQIKHLESVLKYPHPNPPQGGKLYRSLQGEGERVPPPAEGVRGRVSLVPPPAEGVRGRVKAKVLAQNYYNLSTNSTTPTNISFQNIRNKLNKLSLKQLLARLKKIDPKTYKTCDQKNRRRIQRALEIYYQTGKPKSQQEKPKPKYNCLQIGINFPKEIVHKNIEKRLDERLKGGAMTREIKNLHYKKNISWKKLESFGLEYKWVSLYAQNKINYNEMKENLARDIKHFAKRQMTWFKRDDKIIWENDFKKIKNLTARFFNDENSRI